MAHDDEKHARGSAHFDRGLRADLAHFARTAHRRDVLRWLAAATITPSLPLFGCGGDDDSGGTSDGGIDASTGIDAGTDAGAGSDAGSGTCSVIPNETEGPYPADGTQGVNVLTVSGIVRSDIRASVGSSTTVAAGVPLTVTLSLVDTSASCARLSGYAVYLWHCDRDGLYSLYSQGVTNQNYLRGVQATDSNGSVTFTTIFPACYAGRMPHIHFEVYPSLATAMIYTNKLRTSQLALPLDACNAVYATEGYSKSVQNLSQISFASDNVFSDGTSLQLATVTGSVAAGYAASLKVGIAA